MTQKIVSIVGIVEVCSNDCFNIKRYDNAIKLPNVDVVCNN